MFNIGYSWPLLFNAKFFPNFAIECIENSFKTWAEDIHDLGIDSESTVSLQCSAVQIYFQEVARNPLPGHIWPPARVSRNLLE